MMNNPERVDVTIEAPVGGSLAAFDIQPRQVPQGNVRSLIMHTDPFLHEPVAPYNFETDGTFAEQFYLDMVATMRANGGMGLSANQVGINTAMFIVETGGEYPEGFFNPRIVNVSDEQIVLEEGCLSFETGLVVKVKRAKTCRIRYQLLNGETVTKDYTGMTARCILHEMDHLFGVTMKDRANKIHWEAAVKRYQKLVKSK